MRWIPALIVDLLAVLVFVLLGRSSHDEGHAVLGVLSTWWPFAVGTLVGWIGSRSARRPVSHTPTASTGIQIWTGVHIWISTVLLGMVLRWATGTGTAPTFIGVATVALGVLLLGWRAIALLVSRRRKQKREASEATTSQTR